MTHEARIAAVALTLILAALPGLALAANVSANCHVYGGTFITYGTADYWQDHVHDGVLQHIYYAAARTLRPAGASKPGPRPNRERSGTGQPRSDLSGIGMRGVLAATGLCLAVAACSMSNPGSGVTLHPGWSPPAQALPEGTRYREDLGGDAPLVLGNEGLVPYGAPEHLSYLVTCLGSAGFVREPGG